MSAGHRWHAREHKAALDGMLGLSLEERGAFNTVLDLIYDRGGPVPDDARWLAGWMGCSVKKWLILRERLVALGKLYVTPEGALSNGRAEIELERAAAARRTVAESGAKGGRKRAENRAEVNENSGLGLAPLKHRDSTDTATGQKVVVVEGAGEGGSDQPDPSQLPSSRAQAAQRPETRDPAAPALDAARPLIGCAAGSRLCAADAAPAGMTGGKGEPPHSVSGPPRRPDGRLLPSECGELGRVDDWPRGDTPDHARALAALAGPGLAEPAATPNLLLSQAEVGRWRRAGCSWALDVVPTVQALTAKSRADRVQSWSYFTSAVLDRAARRRAPLTLPALPESPTHAHARTPKRAAREDNLGRALHAALAVAGQRGG
jgi:uncharacterized protein YdaU (DUF1376 family)